MFEYSLRHTNICAIIGSRNFKNVFLQPVRMEARYIMSKEECVKIISKLLSELDVDDLDFIIFLIIDLIQQKG